MNSLSLRQWAIAALLTPRCDFSSILYSFVILSRASLIAADVLLLLVTWWQLCGTLGSSGQRRNRSALAVLLLRDSTSYFILFLLLNVAQVMGELMLGAAFDPVPNLMLPIVTIVISRLILSLRRLSFTMQLPMHVRNATDTSATEIQESFHRSFLSTVVFRPDPSPRGLSNHSQIQAEPPELPELPRELMEFRLEPWLVDSQSIRAPDDVLDDDADMDECGKVDEE
ncbi:uncharacterized protein B0H18DRAFT_369732 [Fomitopsis serialis]|uniref:uncharacterized protein n=1 Tax=Fomitopsis serialis TaxID=139415 RepID=UPI002008E503|nr:uncharacterized protein B0H18DRAFT_369732 [Neoantrodia serialis]KAH9925819.1 hypothetical protein B0H18DRAFT_369732 [Neoantrodia serialis]